MALDPPDVPDCQCAFLLKICERPSLLTSVTSISQQITGIVFSRVWLFEINFQELLSMNREKDHIET